MQESTVTAKGQTTLPTLPREVRAALDVHAGGKLRYVVVDGEVRLLKVRSIRDLEGALRRPGQRAASVEEIDEIIAAGAADLAE